MKTQEIVVRVIVESAGGKAEAKQPAAKRAGKNMPHDVYPALTALPIGGTLDLTEAAKTLHITLAVLKSRLYTFVYWYNRKHNENRAYNIARVEAGRIQATRIR